MIDLNARSHLLQNRRGRTLSARLGSVALHLDLEVLVVKQPIAGRILEGRYRLERLLGRGGQAEVYLASDERLLRRVALKRPVEQDLIPDYVKQFRREAKLLAGFEHPNVVKLYDYCEPDRDLPFLVMEYLSGRALDETTRDATRMLSARQILRFVREICSAMQKAHEAGLIHRDLKPRNVMLVNQGRPDERFVLLDLGVAKLADFVGRGKTLADLFGTATGTLGYMSPEQFEKGVTDSKSDIYALGVTLFELWTGTMPFAPPERNDGICAFMLKVIQTPAPLPSQVSTKRKVPAEIDKLVLDCLAKNPDNRPTSMQEVADRYRASCVVHRKREPEPADKRVAPHWLMWAGGLAGVLLLILGISGLYLRPSGAATATQSAMAPAPSGPREKLAGSQGGAPQGRVKSPGRSDSADKLWQPASTIDGLKLAWRPVRRMPNDPPPDTFYILETKVWNDLYNDFASQTKSSPDKAGVEWRDGTWKRGSNSANRSRLPVTRVSALEASAFCSWLAEKLSGEQKGEAGKQRKITVRLPTREEWDRAACYDAWLENDPRMSDVTGPFTGNPVMGTPTPVGDGETENQGTKLWKVKDMAGNGLEWTDNIRGGKWRISDHKRPVLREFIDMIELRGKPYTAKAPLKFTESVFNSGVALPWQKHDATVGFRVVVEIPHDEIIAADHPLPQ